MSSTLLRVSLAVVTMAHSATSELSERSPPSWTNRSLLLGTSQACHTRRTEGSGTLDAKCREQARPPQLDEDKRVRDQGWDRIGAYQGGFPAP